MPWGTARATHGITFEHQTESNGTQKLFAGCRGGIGVSNTSPADFSKPDIREPHGTAVQPPTLHDCFGTAKRFDAGIIHRSEESFSNAPYKHFPRALKLIGVLEKLVNRKDFKESSHSSVA